MVVCCYFSDDLVVTMVVCCYFSADLMSDATCLTTLRQIEGTVILHITQAVKQDQELGKELIKYLKVIFDSVHMLL